MLTVQLVWWHQHTPKATAIRPCEKTYVNAFTGPNSTAHHEPSLNPLSPWHMCCRFLIIERLDPTRSTFDFWLRTTDFHNALLVHGTRTIRMFYHMCFVSALLIGPNVHECIKVR
jgi:hypothetical protein